MSRLFINKSFHRNGKKSNAAQNVSANNNTIYDEERPLQDKNRTVCGAPIKSPQSKFYRNNSNPLPGTVQETKKKANEPRPQKSLGKLFGYIARRRKSQSNEDDLQQQDEITATVLSDESTKIELPLVVPNQVYEQSINKHGDVVEYAVPYSEQMINPIHPLGIVSPVKITDLDKSSDGSRSLDQSGRGIIDCNNKDVLSELDTLERWSQNIPQRSLPPLEVPVNKSVHVIECKSKEIKQKLSVLKNTIAIPLHFSSGYFRKTPVALRKCCPRDSTSVGLVEEAIERDYDILNKVKHANIILLMAASFHRKSFEHMTLVLESVDYTLNYFLHQMDTTMSIVESISVVQQIASAALYLQECGYIHSNISSHNILVRASPWCVKLSSFELTTEVDFADTRVEILIKYRHKLPTVNGNCADTPNYVPKNDPNIPLKDQYKQLSKLLPILKCSPNTQHKYLSMMSKHLIYDSNYRQHLSLHNFQAPELLTTKRQFVFPTPKADVYSLCLLLWEMLNGCVPFVVYSKSDMERMIGSNKLSLPFFERERCEPFMNIFKAGLATNPENRVFDVHQLIKMLEDVKCEIRSEQQPQERSDIDKRNLYVNTTPVAHKKTEYEPGGALMSPDSTDFNQCLRETELTSTKKKRRKSPRAFIKKTPFRQLFNTKETVDSSENDTQLNENVNAIAGEIPPYAHSLDEIEEECESIYNSIVGPVRPVLVTENETPTSRDNSTNVERRKTSPEIVDFEHIDQSPNSKSCSNLFDASTSESRKKFFHSNIVSPPSGGFNVGEYSLPDTPIARKNKIRRNAWLSNKSLNSSNREIDEVTADGNQMNVSIRIVHNKVTPRKSDNGNPLVMSMIKFFDSTVETHSDDNPTSNNKITNNTVDDIDSNFSSNYPIKKSNSKEIIELTSSNVPDSSVPSSQFNSMDRSTERNGTLSNCSTLSMSKHPLSDIETIETNDDSNIITPKWQSVRDKILKFENRAEPKTTKPASASSSFITATEFFRNLTKSTTNQSKLTSAPTLIKRTIYRESIVSGVNLSSLDNQMPLFDQLNLTGQKLTTQVTLNMRQIRRRSSDLDERERRKMDGTTEIRHTICGSQKGLLSFNSNSKDGSAGGKTRYICSDCTSKMSPDELKALTLESVAENSFIDNSLPSSVNDEQKSIQRHCQVRIKSQKTRSIEDLYIDDDFDQGLGANIELQSDCSDFLNFDIVSDVFNKSNTVDA